MFSVNFDFRCDSNNKDPDSHSLMLKKYHQMLWSKKLPNGNFLVIDENLNGYTENYVCKFASDSIIPTYSRWKRYENIMKEIDKEELDDFVNLAYTIGGFVIFPQEKVDGKITINGARGLCRSINDRMDLTLECIRRYYMGEDSPLKECLERYSDFFELFVNFKGYVEFFLLQDLVDDECRRVEFLFPFDDFDTKFSWQCLEDYKYYKDKAVEFVRKRNERIHNWSGYLGQIVYYDLMGRFRTFDELTINNLKNIIGMKVRCLTKQGDVIIGYADPFRTLDKSFDFSIHGYINLWTWDNFDETSHSLIGNDDEKYNKSFRKVYIDDLHSVEAILYSGGSFGTMMTNQFLFFQKNRSRPVKGKKP